MPLVWNAFGRPHARTTKVLQTLAHQAARRRGGDGRALYKRAHAQITVEIWRRAARMVQACLPGGPCEGVFGEACGEDFSDTQLVMGASLDTTANTLPGEGANETLAAASGGAPTQAGTT